MLSIRIVAATAILVAAVGGAKAQTATEAAPGKPIPLLQIMEKPAPKKTHVKTAAKPAEKSPKKVAGRRAAARKHVAATPEAPAETPAPAPTASDAAPDPIWPAANGAPLADANAAIPKPDAATAATDPPLGALVVNGQTVKIASPDEVNEMDLAADNGNTTPAAALKSDFAQVATSDQAAAAREKKQASAVGSASWIAQVLAALGGAIAAGSAAWFLIGSTPQRTYG